MTKPEDTTTRDPLLHLGGALAEGSSGYIENMEAEGGRQMAASDVLPTRYIGDATDERLEGLGFTLGDVVEDDPLFRHGTLPPGWKRETSDHAMWTYIVDERGLRRVGVFYKAAFYDRKAHCHVVNVGNEVAGRALYSGGTIPWGRLTDEEAEMAREYLRGKANNEYLESAARNRVRALLASAPT